MTRQNPKRQAVFKIIQKILQNAFTMESFIILNEVE